MEDCKIEKSLKPETLTRVVNKENAKMQNYFFSNRRLKYAIYKYLYVANSNFHDISINH